MTTSFLEGVFKRNILKEINKRFILEETFFSLSLYQDDDDFIVLYFFFF